MVNKSTLPPPPDVAQAAATPARIASETLLGEARQVVILHNGREYRLRQTQAGKLILTA